MEAVMKPSSRTPEGEPNRCPICGNQLCLKPSGPPRDAPCPFCGSLLGFNTPGDFDVSEMPNARIRLRFHGGCREGRIFANDPKSLAESHGYRYCLLAVQGRVGIEWREVSLAEYGLIAQVLKRYGSVARLSGEELEDIRCELQQITVHVYKVSRREETPEEIAMVLDFVRLDAGV
jgi:hypothetical protein